MPKPIGKVLMADYDKCIEATDAMQECEVCLTRGQIRAILAINDYFSWVTRWYSQGEMSKDKIDAFYSDLTWRLMTVCCCDENQTIERKLDEETGVVMMSTDGGSTFFPDPEDPRNSGVAMPPPVTSGMQADKCAAADAVTRQFQIYVDDIIAGKINDLTLIEIALAIATVCVAIWVTPLWALIPAIIGSLIQRVFAASGAELTAAMGGTTYSDFHCQIYCKMDADGSLSEQGFKDAIFGMSSHLNDLAYNTARSFMLVYGRLGVNNAASLAQSAGFTDCSGCDCEGCDLTDWDTYDVGGAHGIIRFQSADEIIVEATQIGSGDYYAIIVSPGDNICCQLNGTYGQWSGGVFTPGEESGVAKHYNDCGEPIELEAPHPIIGENFCGRMIEWQSATPFAVHWVVGSEGC